MPASSIAAKAQHLPEGEGQADVVNPHRGCEQRGYLLVGEAGYAAAYARHKETQLGAARGIADEVVYIGLYRLDAALHGGNRVALAVVAHALAHHCAETPASHARSSAAVGSSQVASEHKHLVGPQGDNVVGGNSSNHIAPEFEFCFWDSVSEVCRLRGDDTNLEHYFHLVVFLLVFLKSMTSETLTISLLNQSSLNILFKSRIRA